MSYPKAVGVEASRKRVHCGPAGETWPGDGRGGESILHFGVLTGAVGDLAGVVEQAAAARGPLDAPPSVFEDLADLLRFEA